MTDFPPAVWRKSSHSGDHGGECVELADLFGVVGIRDSKCPEGTVLAVERAVARSLFGRIRAGRLDHNR